MQHNTSKLEIKRLIGFSVLVLLACLFRFVPHPPNLSPILALMVIAGAMNINPMIALAMSLAGVYGSDLILGTYDGISFVYLAYVWAFFIGKIVAKSKWQFVIFGGSLSSAAFFVLSNYGVWAFTPLYPKTAIGLIECYLMALPFFHYTVISTVGFLFAAAVIEKIAVVVRSRINA